MSVSYPSKSLAAAQQLDYASYEQMIWSSIGADYSAISMQADQIKQLLATGKKMHISSPAGTDMTVDLASRPVFADDGILSAADQQEKLILNRTARLPGGLVYGTCQETSATGRLAFANDEISAGKPLKGFKADLKNGQVENVRAEVGADAFKEGFATVGASGLQVGRFSIGLNPGMKIDDEKVYHPASAAGMVFVSTGNNALFGGQNKTLGGYSFPIANATVDVDGKVIVRNGQLVSPTMASAKPAPKKKQK
ncbi:aminopeptidase [Hymenobacter jejuensis]|uniref:aminopeptidase n=1 Tax=Hymenobacter jejuensis TaxID=2502781 RepID=UPI0026901114